MSCKSALYTVNNGVQAVAEDGVINLGSVIRRFGNNINLLGNGIIVNGAGYYEVDANVTINATTAGTVTVSLYKDGVPVQGAVATVSVASGVYVTVPIHALIREFGCCVERNSTLTFVLGGEDETVENISVIVERI